MRKCSQHHRLPFPSAGVHVAAACTSITRSLRNQKGLIHARIGSTHPVCDCSDRTKSTSRCLDLGPSILLRVLPSLDEPGHKVILSSVNFRPLCACNCCRAAQPLEFASVSRHYWLWLTCRETMSSSIWSNVKAYKGMISISGN